MSDGLAAYGTILQIGDGATPEVFTNIAEVTGISGPALAQNPIEVTHHESTNAWREYVGGLIEGGEVSLDLNFIPDEATQDHSTGLIYVLVNRSLRNFQLLFPDDSSTCWAFAALVTKFEPSAPVDDKLSATVTLQISGEMTFTTGA